MSYEAVIRRIAQAAERSHRKPEEIFLLPVTKNRPVDTIRTLYDRGLREFGESRVQELLKKKEDLPNDIEWHFIGNLQSNKAKYIAPFVHLVHSLHSEQLADELSKRAKEINRNIPVLIEVNISSEPQKQGIMPEKVERLILDVENYPNLMVHGLMGMASLEENPENTRLQFRRLRELRDTMRERHSNLKSFKELSMGMSNDFEVAIEEGATIVRIGSALFEDENNYIWH